MLCKGGSRGGLPVGVARIGVSWLVGVSNADGRGSSRAVSRVWLLTCGLCTGCLPTDVTKAKMDSSKVIGVPGGALIWVRHMSIARLACRRFTPSSALMACNSSTWFNRASRSSLIRSQSCCNWPTLISVSVEPSEAVFWTSGPVVGSGARASSSCLWSFPPPLSAP